MCWHTAFRVGIGSILLISVAFAIPGNLLWEDYFNRGSFDAVRGITAVDGRIFAVGLTNAIGNSDMGVRAYAAADGTLLWEDHFDRAGGNDEPWAIAVLDGRVFVAGFTVNAVGDRDFSLRAYRSRDGTLLWENHFDRAGGEDTAFAVAAAKERVFAAGITTKNPANSESDFSVRAYQATDGALLWENYFDRGGSADTAAAVATDGQRVFAVGRTTAVVSGQPFFDFSIRAYRASDGVVIWEDHFNRGVSGGEAITVATSGGRVFVGGDTFAAEGDGEFSIRVYNASNGALLWEDHFDRAGGRDAVLGIAVQNRRVFAVGTTCAIAPCEDAAADFDFSVRAYDVADGALLWEDHFNRAGGNDQAFGVAAVGTQVFVVGRSQDAAGNFDWLVRTYRAADGVLLWQDQFDRAGKSDEAQVVTVLGHAVFVGGRTDSPSGNTDFSVRAYLR